MPEWKHHQGVEITEGMLVHDHHSALHVTTAFNRYVCFTVVCVY